MLMPALSASDAADLEQAMLTLAYFGLFQYPLTSAEWVTRCVLPPDRMKEMMQLARQAGLAHESSGFWLIQGAGEEWISKRTSGNRMAVQALETAALVGKTIYQFPFVQAVCVSGSLSKEYFDQDADIDFFIITAEGRLWLARTLLVLYKRLALKGSHKHFCVNYFVSESGLTIPDENIFVATEVATLLPVIGMDQYRRFLASNQWYRRFLPNTAEHSRPLSEGRPGRIRKMAEYILGGRLGDTLDAWCFRLTLNQWKKRFPHIQEDDFDLNLRSRKSVSKHHPRGFQKVVLERLELRMDDFRAQIRSMGVKA